ncbi:MAG: TRAP transporter small permease subunit [Alphaproteobacteria bacterium]|nr:MAG: TRAP transporter small permease subunit [Alphaproteobacteria bacterium]
MSFVRKIDFILNKISSYLLVTSVLVILFFSTSSIVLRWMHINLQWIEPMVKHLVFASAFLGGVIATGRGTHIGIDLVGKFVESRNWDRLKRWISRFVMFVSFCVLVWLIMAGIDFTVIEMEFTKDVGLGFLKSGHLVAIIPIGLSLIALRFFLLLILSFERREV